MKNNISRSSSILLSKRANIFYLEHTRIMLKDNRVIYITEYNKDTDQGFNIPDKNMSFLLLGKGTSITDGAVRMLTASNVVIGFCGSGGSPLFAGVDTVFLTPTEEYRPTEYMQQWIYLWLEEKKRISAAKLFMEERINFTQKKWAENKTLSELNCLISSVDISTFLINISNSKNPQELMGFEAVMAKKFYARLATAFNISSFKRNQALEVYKNKEDIINGFLDHGNYIAYGFAAVSLYALGISFAFPLFHGKTRRGALVFDVADLIKDAIVMPLAFEMGMKNFKDQDYRIALIEKLQDLEVIDFMIDTIKHTINKFA